MAASELKQSVQLLIVNPNSSHDMTHGMEQAIQTMELPDTIQIATYTGPADSPASINDGHDVEESTRAVLKDLKAQGSLSEYDGVLIACYSVHSLVDAIDRDDEIGGPSVTGIFEASILTALSILPSGTSSGSPVHQWGIVTTGKFWEDHLTKGVRKFLAYAGDAESTKFAGVESTGLDAGDFHSVDPAEVKAKLREATLRLLGAGDVLCVVMGCAGMAGLEEIIRTAAVEKYGQAKGGRVAIVDGVKAGILQMELMVRSKRLFAA